MKRTLPKSTAVRGASLGLGLLLAAGGVLAATAPAQAVPGNIEVTASDISTDPATSAGWHQGYGGGTFAVTADGLELTGPAQVLYSFDVDDRMSISDLSTALVDNGVAWTSTDTSAPAFLQVSVSYDVGSRTTTLSPAAPSSGENVAGFGQDWVTSEAITVSGNTVFDAGDTAPLDDLLGAFDPNSDTVLAFGVKSLSGTTSVVTALTFAGPNYVFTQPKLTPGSVTVSGTPAPGSTLTVTTSGWPAGTTFSYEWFWDGGQMGGGIDGATSSTYTVDESVISRLVGVLVTGTKPGFAPASVMSDRLGPVAAPQKPTAAAPAGDSSGLADYLSSKSATVEAQTSTGLPAGELNPGATYTADLQWAGADSFVDAYLYSSPTLVGTFPVVNGVAQIPLSTSLLGSVGAGSHTLVVMGQSSGTVQAVSVSVAASLAATGSELTGVAGLGLLLLVVGAALLVVRRRLIARG